MKNKLESLKNFQLTIEQEQSVNGGRVAADTEICTQRCSSQFDCANDDGSGDYGTDAESDNCGE